jgi:hypothetical protein
VIIQESLIRRLTDLGKQGGFPNLERIDVQTADPLLMSDHLISNTFGDMKNLSTWIRYIPSLKGASVYGIEML